MRKSVLIICGLVLAVCLWLLWHRRTEAPGTGGEPVAEAVTNQNPTATPRAAVSAPVPSAPAPVAGVPHAPANSAPTAVLPTVKELLQKPIDFYGQVIDENSNPVSGASIEFRWDDLTAKDWTRTSTAVSDTEGVFSLRDKRGATLTVSVSKEGYYTPRSGRGSYHYAFGNPNSRQTGEGQICRQAGQRVMFKAPLCILVARF